jgi:hypothetical protein
MAIWNIYGHLGYFMTIWYILCSFGTFFQVLVSWTNKNLATLLKSSILPVFPFKSKCRNLSKEMGRCAKRSGVRGPVK